MKCFNIVDAGYLRLAQNQIANFQQTHMKSCKLHLYCLDQHSLDQLTSYSQHSKNVIVVNAVQKTWSGQEAHYGDNNFRQLMKLRPRMFMSIVKELGGALHTEADVFWFKSPEELINSHNHFDWIIQHDGPGHGYGVAWLNIGCAYYSSTAGSLKLFEMWIRHHDKSNLMDQEALCELLQTTVNPSYKLFPILTENFDFAEATKLLGVEVQCFDKQKVQNGHVAFKEGFLKKYDCHALHVNHHTGVETKINLLKSSGAWLI